MNNDNFTVAVILSIAILVGFHYFYEKPHQAAIQQRMLTERLAGEAKPESRDTLAAPKRSRQEIIAESKRIPIKSGELSGSVNLKGARIDDLSLTEYRESTDKDSKNIVLLSPAGSADPNKPYYTEFGWLGDNTVVPDSSTEWKATSKELTPSSPLYLSWDNGHGLVFEKTISIDEQFLFTITDRVKNNGGDAITLYPFGLLARHGKPHTQDTYVLHEGPMGAIDGTIVEHKYKDLMSNGRQSAESTGGWLGITDKYWLVALIPSQNEKIATTFTYEQGNDPDPAQGLFQVDYRGTPVTLAAGASTERSVHMFAGAKRVRLLDKYENQLSIPHFDRAIDFGWFYFLTKPFLYLLDIMGEWFGNFGIAILVFTVMLKIVTLPLSVKSYRSMARLKELQPEIKRIQEKYGDDKMRMNVETMELYKREKVNPASGCLPTFIQIPIFFALYKVLFVGIEIRQAPFYGWIKDLSDADPTSVLTLFDTVQWSFIPHVGVWPLLMGISMFMQQKLSPQPPDKSQARVFMFMPIIFTFMLSKVAAGLVIYWTWSNILGIGQQWYIMKSSGHKK